VRITTWNINSVRLRLAGLARVVETARPDVLCLQEIKTEDDGFPRAAVAAMGMPHMLVRGNKGYHGVAILSRTPLRPGPTQDWCGRQDGRHICARIGGGIEVHNFYVPSGGDIPDPAVNDKFAHKLAFLDEMIAWSSALKPGKRVLVGDLNVAPGENDVWSHKQLLDVVSHTPAETDALRRLAETRKWVDVARRFVPDSQKLYTWWSYRNRTWPGSDRGRRLDHVWVTPQLAPALKSVEVLRDERGWPSPSDHVPVTVELDV